MARPVIRRPSDDGHALVGRRPPFGGVLSGGPPAFRAGLAFFIIGVVVISGAGVAFTGLAYSSGSLQNLAIPLALAALLVGRKALWTTTIFYAVALAVGAARDSGLLWGLGPRIATVSPSGIWAARSFRSASSASFSIASVCRCATGSRWRSHARRSWSARRLIAEANAALKEEMARRQSAEAQLIEAQKMEAIARLSGGIAHDFNNLLTVILSCTDLSKESLHADHPVRPNLDDIGEAAERAAELTRQLLAFARRQMVEPRVLCVADRVRATEKMLARLLGEDVRLVTRFAAEAWLVQVDPGQLDQVILNFAVNARDAMPEGGKLLVATKNVTLQESKSSSLFSIPAGDYLMLEISDEGIGMDAETGSRLFEPFFTTKAHGKGTGLGLATCYGIMLQAGGAIFFQTEIGRGTTFHLYFPRVLICRCHSRPRAGAPRRGGVESGYWWWRMKRVCAQSPFRSWKGWATSCCRRGVWRSAAGGSRDVRRDRVAHHRCRLVGWFGAGDRWRDRRYATRYRRALRLGLHR